LTDKILLGYEVGSGEPVFVPLHHLAIFGMTQLSGKTTTLEGLISRSGLRAIAFITKRGEAGFTRYNLVTPYYKPRADWQFVEGLVNVALGEKVKYEPGMRYAIMKVCRGRKDLKEIQLAARSMAKTDKSAFMRSVYEKLDAYLEIVIPELEKWTFTDRLKLNEGINVMDLSGMRLETQHIVIASTIEYAFANLDHVIVIIPEAWETIPQGKMTPVKWVAQQFIRKGAALGNYLWLDSQDIGGIDKTPLRQCDNWLMGRMKEAHEVERILKQLLGAKVPAEEIQTLPLGCFYAAIANDLRKVYVLPVGVPENVGIEVAQGSRTPESVRDEFLKPKVMEVDDLVWKEKFEQEKRKREAFEKQLKDTLEQVTIKTDMDRGYHDKLQEENVAFRQQLEQDKSVIEKLEKELKPLLAFKETLVNFLGTYVPKAGPPGFEPGSSVVPSEVIVGQEIPQVTVSVKKPVVETDEGNWRGRLIILIAKGYFDEPRRLTPIRERLQQDYGQMPNAALISNELVELLKMHLLVREQQAGQWVYTAYPGAKERIKKAES